MSHFDTDTLIRVHKPDATEETSFEDFDAKYYQRIAYSPFDRMLYGVESSSIVSISEGKPTTVAALGVDVFEREPRALGVAPGILALIPVAPETLVVVPNRSAPLMLRGRKLVPLQDP